MKMLMMMVVRWLLEEADYQLVAGDDAEEPLRSASFLSFLLLPILLLLLRLLLTISLIKIGNKYLSRF